MYYEEVIIYNKNIHRTVESSSTACSEKTCNKPSANPLTTAHANWVRQTAVNTANTSTWIQEQLQKQSKVSQQQFNDQRKQCEVVQQNIIETKKKQLAELQLQRNASNHHAGVAYHGPIGVGPQTLNCMHTIKRSNKTSCSISVLQTCWQYCKFHILSK